MPLSWNEIRRRAIGFAKDWAAANRERAEAQSFWNDFFDVFGLKRRTVASFEEPVRNLRGHHDFIDLFWKGTLIAEHKSRGGNLGRAHLQAIDYIQDLQRENRGDEVPEFVIASDFAQIALHTLESRDPPLVFDLAELHRNIHAFGFIAGYQTLSIPDQDPINVKAVKMMATLHAALQAGGYCGHDLERLLVRVLFCLFAEDSGIFEPDAFRLYVEHHTAEDGSDLGIHLARLFDVLNTPRERRQTNLIEELADLPHVNGELFAEPLAFADFNRDMRNALLACTRFHWQYISPAVFGSMFQAVLDSEERRQSGAHYTSETDILKVIRSTFLDELEADLQKARGDRRQLDKFRRRLGDIRIIDPACGCGNFLVLAYRELRRLEIEALQASYSGRRREQFLDLRQQLHVDVDQMYGIEIQEWPVRIAETALWLMDHQMNQLASQVFGEYVLRLPLEKSPTIVHDNALRLDWRRVLSPNECSYIVGNPPFVGTRFLTVAQKEDLRRAAPTLPNRGLVDYVAAWYFKAAEYMKSSAIVAAFVSTNSISQGEQVGIIWPELFRRGIHIHFAHRTFPWRSEAEGAAHVHVVIIGFGMRDTGRKRLYDYEADENNRASVTSVRNISPYLIEGGETVVTNRSRPLCLAPVMRNGNQPIDDGNYIFSSEEKEEFLNREPSAGKYFRPFVGAEEYINGIERWFLWLGDCVPSELRRMPSVVQRVRNVRRFRVRSKRSMTQRLAARPTRLSVETMPTKPYLVIPLVSSVRRAYIPMGFVGPEVLISNLCSALPEATMYHFGVLTSAMHHAWVRTVCGRLKSDFRYSKKLVYNNFPWPDGVSDSGRENVEDAAREVLDAREGYEGASLADLYDPLTMPRELRRAHDRLDRIVDKVYRKQKFSSDRDRVEMLFARFESIGAPLTAKTQMKRRRQPKK